MSSRVFTFRDKRLFRRYVRRLVFGCILFLVCLSVLWFARFEILKGVGDFLIKTDNPQEVEVLFVLAGAAEERGAYAAKLYKDGWADRVVCTGELPIRILEQVCKTQQTEAMHTQKILEEHDVPASKISLLKEGTSTLEECVAILRYCKANKINRIMVVSSLHHTRRIAHVLKPRAARVGVHTVVMGAPHFAYDTNRWFKSEEGLLFVNNEFMKLAYYIYKY